MQSGRLEYDQRFKHTRKMSIDEAISLVSDIIREIGKDSNGGKATTFNLDKLLEKWKEYHSDKNFKKTYRSGSLQKFLSSYFEMELDGRDGKITKHKMEVAVNSDNKPRQPAKQDGGEATTNPTQTTIGIDNLTNQQSDPKLEQLRTEILSIIQDVLRQNLGRSDDNKRCININSLREPWQKRHEKKFTLYNFGGFKEFLLNHCCAKASKTNSEELIFSRKEIEQQLLNTHKDQAEKSEELCADDGPDISNDTNSKDGPEVNTSTALLEGALKLSGDEDSSSSTATPPTNTSHAVGPDVNTPGPEQARPSKGLDTK